MNRKNIKQGALTLFNRDYLDKLKRNKFNGRLTASWKDGSIQHCKLVAKVTFFKGKEEDASFFIDD